MNKEIVEELYLSFAGIFQRPRAEISDHLEQLAELWSEFIPAPPELRVNIDTFCSQYPAGEARLNTLWEHYIPLFEVGKVEAPPYASVYLDYDNQVMGKETLTVEEFYASQGYSINEKERELPDHIRVELEFAALLAHDNCLEALADFRQRHLLPFLSAILPSISQTGRPVFAATAELLHYWQFQAY